MKILGNTAHESGFGACEIDIESGVVRPVDTKESLPTVAPGFVDVHVHGGFGIDFMRAEQADILRWCSELDKRGYEAFLPSTVTASPEAVLRTLASLPVHPMIAGFHLEGPFISTRYPGAQPKQFIAQPRDPGWEEILKDPRLKLITMAPELPGALDLAGRLAGRGVVVSMGHTDATYEQAKTGYDAGYRHATHTYNAMRPLHHREPGTVGFALTCNGLSCELIYDRHHVSKQSAEVLVRCKPKDKLVAVSDGTFAIGMPPGQVVHMWGLDCVIGDGQIRLTDGSLAGSAITLHDAFRNLASDFGAEVAIRACCLNPRAVLGWSHHPRVWIEFDEKWNLHRVHRRAG